MPDNTARKQAYFFACLAAITTIGGAVGSYEYRELKEAYHAEQARSSALAARLQEAMAARDEGQDEDQEATGSGGETAVAAVQTLAIRNNNPLNVKTVKGSPWFGQIAVDRHGHAVFDTPEHGIRAGANVLLKQGSNCFTPDAVRQRFMPVNELIMQERMAESCKATLRSLDAELRREAAAW